MSSGLRFTLRSLLAENSDKRNPQSMVASPQTRVREWARIIFRTEELAEQYLARPHAIFGGSTPLQIARTHKGANWVIEEITDAAFGTPILPTRRRGKAPPPSKRCTEKLATSEPQWVYRTRRITAASLDDAGARCRA